MTRDVREEFIVGELPPEPESFPGRGTRIAAWWSSLDPHERVLYRGLGLLAAGAGLVAPPLALIVPGVVLTVLAVTAGIAIILRGG